MLRFVFRCIFSSLRYIFQVLSIQRTSLLLKSVKQTNILLSLYFSDCDGNHWGPACSQSCKCKNRALCDPITGTCQCPPGFIGRYCEDLCPAGTFGKRCLQRCKCGTGGSCDKATGECLCQDGFTGTL